MKLHSLASVTLPAYEPDDQLVQRETAERLKEALNRLPLKLREALTAKEGVHPEGLACRELAQRYRVSRATIYNRAEAGAKQVRRFLGGQP